MAATLLDYALTTVADVKEILNIDSSNTSKDNLITRKINQATEMIERYCSLPRNHHFLSETYENEEYNGTGTDEIVLRMSPVDSEATFTLQERGTTQNSDDWDTVDTELYHIDYDAGIIKALFTFLPHDNLYRVTYDAGYDPVPEDIVAACDTLAIYLYENPTGGISVKRKREGQREIEYHAPNASDTKQLIKSLGLDDILDPYGREPLQDAR